MAKRTSKEVNRDIERLRKYWENYSGRIVSLKDFAERLNVSDGQLDYMFRRMKGESKEEVEQIKAQINPLTKMARELKNYKTLYFLTDTQMGINQTKKRGIFINPLSLNKVLEEGIFNPRKDDILYIVERCDGKILFRKFLVLKVETKKKNRKVSVLTICKFYFHEKDASISDLLYNGTFDGIDCYIMSKV